MLDKPIIIAGGGIGGLTLAIMLGKNNIPSIVLEQAEKFGEIGAGIYIGPDIFKMFDIIGIIDSLKKVTYFPDFLIIKDGLSNEVLLEIPFDKEIIARFQYPNAVVRRQDLIGELVNECKKYPSITIKLNEKVVGYEDSKDQVSVKTQSGSNYTGSALIGADGVRSRIRSLLLNDGDPILSGHVCYRGLVPKSALPEHMHTKSAVVWFGNKFHGVCYPLLERNIYNVVLVYRSKNFANQREDWGTLEEFRSHFIDATEDVRTLVSVVDEKNKWMLCDRESVKVWSKGRVALIGDAAHPMFQYIGQGAGMAVEDAVIMANKIKTFEDDLPRAFTAYQEERYLRATKAQITARFYGDFYHATGAARDLRNQILKSMSKEDFFEHVAWLYTGIEVK